MNPPVEATKYWLEKTVIGFNFCPFAKRELDRETIRFISVETVDKEAQLLTLIEECKYLDNHSDVETTILIFPNNLGNFDDYLDFLDIANQLLEASGYEGVYQLASFHPDYCFDGVSSNDPSNFTNRSPFPLLHLLREASLEKAIEHYPDPENIPDRNISKANEVGEEVFKSILKKCFKQK